MISRNLQDAPAMDMLVSKPWNLACQSSFDRWLVPNHDEEAKQKLKVMGNCVIPAQAAAGFAVLSHMAPMNSQ